MQTTLTRGYLWALGELCMQIIITPPDYFDQEITEEPRCLVHMGRLELADEESGISAAAVL